MKTYYYEVSFKVNDSGKDKIEFTGYREIYEILPYLESVFKSKKIQNSKLDNSTALNIIKLLYVAIKEKKIKLYNEKELFDVDKEEIFNKNVKTDYYDIYNDDFILKKEKDSLKVNYDGFKNYGLNIIAGFDKDYKKIGEEINGKKIYHIDDVEEVIKQLGVKIAILTSGKDTAQEVADRLVAAGIKAIWNFARKRLEVDDSVVVENVDLPASLSVLSYKMAQKESKN